MYREPHPRPERLYNGKPVKMDSLRYQTFVKTGTECCFCGLKATFFALERQQNNKNSNPERWHLNLYGRDTQGEEVLFTKDHVIPRSKGGSDYIDNLKTACYPCNSNKGNNHTVDWSKNQLSPKRRIKKLIQKTTERITLVKKQAKAAYQKGTPYGGSAYLLLKRRRDRLRHRLESLIAIRLAMKLTRTSQN